MPALTPQLALRLLVLGLVVVLVQVAAVSQITIFGANADLTPLVVAFVGLLCGSVIGATFGFVVGLFVDIALLQTLGLQLARATSPCGYGAGRLRELRDPQAARDAAGRRRARHRDRDVGFSLMKFLLGVDAPGELPAAAPDPRDDRASTRSSRCRSSRSCAAGCCPRCPTTRAAAGAAPTRPAACPRSRAR